jgi:hypothetical protein
MSSDEFKNFKNILIISFFRKRIYYEFEKVLILRKEMIVMAD